MMTNLCIRLDEELKQAMQEIANEQKLPLSYIARCAFEAYVKDWEEKKDGRDC